jgi:malonate transporter MadM subunit
MPVVLKVIAANQLVAAFATVGVLIWLANFISRHVFRGRIQGSAIAILGALALAYWGGVITGKDKGLGDVPAFAGLVLMGGAMFRDFCIVATASEVRLAEARKAGWLGFLALVLGTLLPFVVGVGVARAFGYTDPVVLTTIGAGAVTYIVGPVTGAALGASSAIIALSIATGVIKAIIVMVATPMLARFLRLDNPQSAMVFGGLAGTVSGVSAGLAATDRRLVPYGALVSTFHTGFGCLVVPSLLFLAVKAWCA